MTVENIGELQGFYYIGIDGYPYVFPAIKAGSIIGNLIVAFEFVLMLVGFYKLLYFVSSLLCDMWESRSIKWPLLMCRRRIVIGPTIAWRQFIWTLRHVLAWLVSPVMILARFRFSKNWRHAETGVQAFVYTYVISTVSANYNANKLVEFFITEKGTKQ